MVNLDLSCPQPALPPGLPAARAAVGGSAHGSAVQVAGADGRPTFVQSSSISHRAGNPQAPIVRMADNPRMHLTPRERERLLLAAAADLARRRLARGARLGATEAVALVCDEACEMAWDGIPLEDVIERARQVIAPGSLLPGVAGLVPVIEVEALFPWGTTLVHIDAPFGRRSPASFSPERPGAVRAPSRRHRARPRGGAPGGPVAEHRPAGRVDLLPLPAEPGQPGCRGHRRGRAAPPGAGSLRGTGTWTCRPGRRCCCGRARSARRPWSPASWPEAARGQSR